MAKAAFNKKKNLFASKLDLNIRKKLAVLHWIIGLFCLRLEHFGK